MRIIFLILIGISILNSFALIRFNRVNGAISDRNSKLEWQDDYSDNNNIEKQTTWRNSIDYCENLTLNTKNDWRLPNITELISLVDESLYNPVVYSIFEHITPNNYWSSTSNANLYDSSKIISFQNGTTTSHSKSYTNYVMCVRTQE